MRHVEAPLCTHLHHTDGMEGLLLFLDGDLVGRVQFGGRVSSVCHAGVLRTTQPPHLSVIGIVFHINGHCLHFNLEFNKYKNRTNKTLFIESQEFFVIMNEESKSVGC